MYAKHDFSEDHGKHDFFKHLAFNQKKYIIIILVFTLKIMVRRSRKYTTAKVLFE
jgi:hypothetical protein